MAEHLGANFNTNSLKTWFSHPMDNHTIFLFLDPCHMLKLVRNCLATYKKFTTKDDEIIDWRYIDQLVCVQTKEGLSAATKLRKRHIQWENEKMKVADALRFLEYDMKLVEFQGSSATAYFSEMLNNVFDIFNSKSKYSRYEYKKGLDCNNASAVFAYLDHCKEYIKDLKTDDTTVLNCRRKTGFLGFLICIDSLQAFYM
nr:unnamed protein product [Callosobruchus analis]